MNFCYICDTIGTITEFIICEVVVVSEICGVVGNGAVDFRWIATVWSMYVTTLRGCKVDGCNESCANAHKDDQETHHAVNI